MDNPAFTRIQAQIDAAPVVLFMKGNPMFPQCGFSARVVQILKHSGVQFSSVNVLEDPEIREGIKEFSDWPIAGLAGGKGHHAGRRRLKLVSFPVERRAGKLLQYSRYHAVCFYNR
jgi:monothiol glutaredoxin